MSGMYRSGALISRVGGAYWVYCGSAQSEYSVVRIPFLQIMSERDECGAHRLRPVIFRRSYSAPVLVPEWEQQNLQTGRFKHRASADWSQSGIDPLPYARALCCCCYLEAALHVRVVHREIVLETPPHAVGTWEVDRRLLVQEILRRVHRKSSHRVSVK